MRVRVIGQTSRSIKLYFWSHLIVLQVIIKVMGHMVQGQKLHGSRLKVNLQGQDQGHKSKMWFSSNLTHLQVVFEVKGDMGQGQRSLGLSPA